MGWRPDGLFTMGQERLAVEMHKLIIRIWEQEELSEKKTLDVIQSVCTKGDRQKYSNFSCNNGSCSADLHPLLQIWSAATKLGLLKTNLPLTNFLLFGRSSRNVESVRLQSDLRHHILIWAMEHHEAVPLSWEIDPAVRGRHERGAVQGDSVLNSQGSEAT